MLKGEAVLKRKPDLSWLVAIILFGLTLSLGVLTSRLDDPVIIPANQRTVPRIPMGELAGTSQVCQTFVATYDRLSEVQVRMHNLGRKTQAPFIFHLRFSPDTRDVVTLESNTSLVGDEDYVRFAFTPIPESYGKTWTFCLEAPQVELHEAVTVWGILEETYPEGEIIFRGIWGEEAGVKDLNFRLGYDLGLLQKVKMIVRQIPEYKPFLCGDWRFYALLITIYGVLSYALFFKLSQFAHKERF